MTNMSNSKIRLSLYSDIDRDDLYQHKYEYYRFLATISIVVSSLANVTYWVSDCQLFHRFAWETLPARVFMLCLMVIYIPLALKVKDYKIMVPVDYLFAHGIVWCTIWAIWLLPDRIHANEGFIIVQFMFLLVGFAAPVRFSIPVHSVLILNIVVSNLFNHYKNFDLILSLGLPVLIGSEFVLCIIQKKYIEHYDLQMRLEMSLVHDPLTNAYNRNIFREICFADTDRLIFQTAGIVMLDIDFFKNINDNYGHINGDKVLVELVEIVRNSIRKADYVVRFGGEEFLIILPECSREKTLELAELIRKRAEADSDVVCKFTISVGVSDYLGEDLNKDVDRADKALYYAKEHGRNTVECFWDMVE